ncbi:DUF4252 domain-containing protein [Reichenbachiella sp.]|uniref:DUF4252 domain-containing protein n=1 Tax=Reichenbachiella sp. TaxID=2184521 RepID=UPI003BB1545E
MNNTLKGQLLTHSALFMKSRVLLLSLGLMVISLVSIAQSSSITSLKKDKLTSMDLHFYPSTLRMVNLDNNEEFNRLIQDIEKLVFFKMNGKFENIDMYNLVNQLESNEDFEEYVVVDGPTKKFYLLGREKPTETVGLALLDNEHYVFDIAGSLELKELPKLYQYISENDSTFQNKFSQILGLMEFGEDVAD